MAETQVGSLAVAWATVTGATGSGVGTLTVQDSTYSREAGVAETRNSTGQIVNRVFFNHQKTISMNVTPTGTTLALAKAANILPAPGTIITVADTDDADIDSTNSGKYVLLRATKNKSNTEPNRLSFEMVQEVDVDNAVVISS